MSKKNVIDEKYNEYMRPVTKSEARKIQLNIRDLIQRYESIKCKDSEIPKPVDAVLYALSKFINNKNMDKTSFVNDLLGYISENGYTRIFMDKNLSDDLKVERLSMFLLNLISNNPAFLRYALLDKDGLEYMRLNALEYYMMAQPILQGKY